MQKKNLFVDMWCGINREYQLSCVQKTRDCLGKNTTGKNTDAIQQWKQPDKSTTAKSNMMDLLVPLLHTAC